MLMVALAIAYASRAARPHGRTIAPWVGLTAGCLVLSPVVLFEARNAQIDAALRGKTLVGCNTPVRDDFDDWWPRDRWRTADVILWVSDERFGGPPDLPTHATVQTREVPIERAGRTVRTFTISVLVRRVAANLRRSQEHPRTVLKEPCPSVGSRSLRRWFSS